MSTNRAQRIREAIDNQTGLEGGYFKFLGDVTGKLTPMGKLALQAGGQDMIKATYAAVEQDPHSRNRYLTGLVSRLETKATKHESADDTLQEEKKEELQLLLSSFTLSPYLLCCAPFPTASCTFCPKCEVNLPHTCCLWAPRAMWSRCLELPQLRL